MPGIDADTRSGARRGCGRSRRHILTDTQGGALAVPLPGGNRNNVALLPLLDSGAVGRPRRKPNSLFATRG
ncbi:hypothetical protein OG612_40220 [Streptomyces sp. NBC_01527]|uniref:hypothetical protein n=1 Tax=Streptomyces sp. NBC_01527 TaxID=2903894 RepID=UPI00386BBD49